MQPAAQPVVVTSSAPASEAPLPDIPKAVHDCMSRSMKTAQSRAQNADGAIEISQKVDSTKQSCWRSHLRWYAELQAQRGGATGLVKSEPEKKAKKPTATWE